MSQEQNSTISGSIYDQYTKESAEYREGRMPRVGQTCKFEDGRRYVFCHTREAIAINSVVAARTPRFTGGDEGGVYQDAAAGTYEILATMAGSFNDGECDGGFIQVQKDTPERIVRIYKVKRTKVVSVVDKLVRFTLYDPLQEPISTASAMTAFHLRTRDTGEGGPNNDGIGLSQVQTIAGVDNYFWVQYAGQATSSQFGSQFTTAQLVQVAGGLLGPQTDLGQIVVATSGRQSGSALRLWLKFPDIG